MERRSQRALTTSAGKGLRGGVVGGELTPELLGVGYIIGPKIASIMLAGGVLAYLVLTPMVFLFGNRNMLPDGASAAAVADAVAAVRTRYILYIGAGAVAAGGIISMLQALPMIFSSLKAGLRDMVPSGGKSGADKTPRTEQDLPMAVVILGAVVLVLAMR